MVCVLLIFSSTTLMAQIDFDAYRKSKQKEFGDYKQKKQLEFADYLKQKWEEFETFKGRKPPMKPDPVTLPVADPTEDIPVREVPVTPAPPEEKKPTPPEDSKPVTPVTPPEDKKPVPPVTPPEDKKPDPAPAPPSGIQDKLVADFLGYKLNVTFDKSLRESLTNTSEEGVARFWESLARADSEGLLKQCKTTCNTTQVNDWGCYLFVKELADKIYTQSQSDEKTVFKTFMLDGMGLKARIARDGRNGNLVLLLAIADEVYSWNYLVFSGTKYYVVEGNSSGSLFTYNERSGTGNKALSLLISRPINAAHIVKRRTFECKVPGCEKIEIAYNPSVVAFMDKMPFTDLSLKLNSECSEDVTASIGKAFRPLLEGKSDKEKVSVLLGFMHQNFPYKVDQENHGREKWNYYEETFYYQYSDCDDNATLFANLVRRLVGLKVIGLMYDDHASVAVKFNEDVGGSYIMYQGEKYTICDPTYFGSRIGQCMPQYLNRSAQAFPVK